MCFHTKQSKEAQTLNARFKAKVLGDISVSCENYNGFMYPKTPVITNKDSDLIQAFNWGLIPAWAKDKTIQSYTLNAKIETLAEKPSFRDCIKNRCLILADGFWEWQWLDPKGKTKQKYLITLPTDDVFAFAGLWSAWTDKATGEIIHSYTIVTTVANPLMATIHNTKKRMPVILTRENENLWLAGNATEQFTLPKIELKAVLV